MSHGKNRDTEEASRTAEHGELQQLSEENARLKVLPTGHGIAWEETLPTEPESPPPTEPTPAPAQFTTDEKIALFRRMFRGRRPWGPVLHCNIKML